MLSLTDEELDNQRKNYPIFSPASRKEPERKTVNHKSMNDFQTAQKLGEGLEAPLEYSNKEKSQGGIWK